MSIIRDLFPPFEKKITKFPFSEEERKFQKKSRQTKIFWVSSRLVYHMKARVAFGFWFIGMVVFIKLPRAATCIIRSHIAWNSAIVKLGMYLTLYETLKE